MRFLFFVLNQKRMLKKLVSGLGILLGLNILIKPVWIFFIDLTVQNRLGSAIYGEYFALLNFTFLWNILLDIGITNFNNRNIAQNKDLLPKHFPKILSLRFIMGLGYLVFCVLAAWVLDYSERQIQLIVWLGVNQFLSLLILYLRSNLSGLMLFRLDAIFSVLDRLLMTAIMAALLFTPWLGGRLEITDFIGAQTIAYLLSAGCLIVILLRKIKRKEGAWSVPFKLVVLKKSFPFAVLVLLMTLYTRTDSVMLERLCENGASESGLYARGFRLLEALNMVAFLFAGLLLPIFSKLISESKPIQFIAGISFRTLFGMSWIAIWSSAFWGDSIMAFLYPSAGELEGLILGGLMWAFLGMSTTYVFGTLLTANGDLKSLNRMAVVGVAVNIGLNFLLIPEYGALGAVVATAVTQIGTAVFQMALCQREFGFRFADQPLWGYLSFLLGVPLMAFGAHELGLPWLVQLSVLCVLGGLLLLGSKMVSIRGILLVLKSEKEQ